jgi:YesN/AraC family two-component response regulator
MNPEVLVKLQAMKVLFIDDEENIVSLVSGLFTDLGVNHDTASNGKIALDKVLEKKGTDEQYDLIITDINMPVMSGLSMIERLNSEDICIPTVVISAFTDGQYMDKAKELGVKYYLNKPFEFMEVMKIVEKI